MGQNTVNQDNYLLLIVIFWSMEEGCQPEWMDLICAKRYS